MSKRKQIQRAQQRQRRAPARSAPTAKQAERSAGPTQAERLEQARRSRRRKTRFWQFAGVAVAVAAVVVGLGWRIQSGRAEKQAIAVMTDGSCRFDRRSDPGRANQHAEGATFQVEPPSGGIHDARPAAPRIYADGSAPPDAQVVHALEHGDIALWYRADASAATRSALEELAAERSNDVLVLPRPGLVDEVAAVAWHRRLLCRSNEPASLRRFIARYADKGPESQPEESAAGGAVGSAAGGSTSASRTT